MVLKEYLFVLPVHITLVLKVNPSTIVSYVLLANIAQEQAPVPQVGLVKLVTTAHCNQQLQHRSLLHQALIQQQEHLLIHYAMLEHTIHLQHKHHAFLVLLGSIVI